VVLEPRFHLIWRAAAVSHGSFGIKILTERDVVRAVREK
jgi:hypothetical protein